MTKDVQRRDLRSAVKERGIIRAHHNLQNEVTGSREKKINWGEEQDRQPKSHVWASAKSKPQNIKKKTTPVRGMGKETAK